MGRVEHVGNVDTQPALPQSQETVCMGPMTNSEVVYKQLAGVVGRMIAHAQQETTACCGGCLFAASWWQPPSCCVAVGLGKLPPELSPPLPQSGGSHYI